MSFPIKPITVTASIPATPAELFAYVADTRNDPEWNANVTDVRQVAGDGVGVGAEFTFVQRIAVGSNVLESDVSVSVVEMEERSIVWAVEDKFQQRRITLSIEPDGDGSRITQTTEASFKRKPGWNRFVYPLLAKRTFKGQFEALKTRFVGEPER